MVYYFLPRLSCLDCGDHAEWAPGRLNRLISPIMTTTERLSEKNDW